MNNTLTEIQLQEILGHLQTATTGLAHGMEIDFESVRRELNAAIFLLDEAQFSDPYADTSLRPGLNKPTEDSANV